MRKCLCTVVAGYCLTLPAVAQSTENVTVDLLPGASYSVRFRVGTSVTRVNQMGINETMNDRTVPGKPLPVVRARATMGRLSISNKNA